MLLSFVRKDLVFQMFAVKGVTQILESKTEISSEHGKVYINLPFSKKAWSCFWKIIKLRSFKAKCNIHNSIIPHGVFEHFQIPFYFRMERFYSIVLFNRKKFFVPCYWRKNEKVPKQRQFMTVGRVRQYKH